ncbi:sulfotransferase 1B1-like [Amblyomma americanum]
MAKRKPFAKFIDGVPRDPHCNAELLREALRFCPGKDDLVVISYPKAGTHWVLYILQLILKRGEPVSSYQEFKENMRYLGVVELEGWEPNLPLRLFQTHLPPRKEAIRAKGKFIYVARNPWDVAVSLFHMVTNLSLYRFEDGSFDELLDAFLSDDVAGYGSYFDHVISGHAIKDEANVFFVTYENLLEDTKGMVMKLAHFLGEDYARELQMDEELCRKLLTRCKADQMRETMIEDLDKHSGPEFNDVARNLKVTCKDGFRGDGNKYCFVREGKGGNWKEYFSAEQLQRMEAAIRGAEEKSPVIDLWRNTRSEAFAASGTQQ